MADTTALKNRIRAAIKANDNQEITGPVLQQALLDIVDELNEATESETSHAQEAESTLQQNITAEKNRAEEAESALQQNIIDEKNRAEGAETQLNSLITSIKNNIDNGYVYAGIATPTDTPVTGKVFYIAIQAGTYTNYGGLVVMQGINILKYDGTTWSQEQLIGVDDEPTAGSKNLVKSEGIFNNLSAFDISELNATENPHILATYTDLSAALEALPDKFRKGGMSVKFVQSSDNKYVQYRLMSDSFGTIESDWQNIGLAQQIGLSETVAMSQKAVTDELNKIDSRIRMTEINWFNLKQLRDNGRLIPGMQYRIIDYDCYTTQENTQSAAHEFDIIVTADSANKLNESARAIQHNGDTYFSSCNLAAWKIWYCLDNDTKRFAWADETDGKGVIYRMIDEHGNDCPYDFKNIMFKRYYSASAKDKYGYDYISLGKYEEDDDEYGSITDTDITKSKYLYTFSRNNNGSISDASILNNCINNVIFNAYMDITVDDNENYKCCCLNNIVLIMDDGNIPDYDHLLSSYNKFGAFCTNCTLVSSYYNTIGNNCHNIILGERCANNTISRYCDSISIEYGTDNFIGTGCKYIHLSCGCLKNDIKDSYGIEVNVILCNSKLAGAYMKLNGPIDNNTYDYINVSPLFDDNGEYIELSKYLTPNVLYPQFIGINSSKTIVSYTLDKIINS